MKTGSARVLIVDDMLMNRIVLASLLGSNGIMSDQVESGKECLELCETNDYDLILLDHRMPELDGVDTLIRLKELFEKQGKDIPVIVHTTEEGRSNINLYKAAGFADVLIKPVDPRELFNVLMEYLPGETDTDGKNEDGVSDLLSKTGEHGGDDGTGHPDDMKKEVEKLPMWLKIIPGIDLASGVTGCGSAEDYLDAVYIFYSSVKDKSEEIERFLVDGDTTMYTLRMHSIKSMARLIGAKKLGEMAGDLEEAARAGDDRTVNLGTSEFIRSYRELGDSLSPVLHDDTILRFTEEEGKGRDNDRGSGSADHSRCVLYIQNGEGVVKKGIENNLAAAGFNVITVPDEPDRIIFHRKDADIIVYYPVTDENSHTVLTMNLLGEICQDDAKIMCLAGDADEVDKIMSANGSHRVSRCYERPLDVDRFIRDMEYFSKLEANLHRKKTIFVVDDDPGYLSVAEHWLSGRYHVSCFNSGDEVIKGLQTVIPDMILLDYEMPQMNGFMLMKSIRTDFPGQHIPIIFLTGKNERDHVAKVLEHKPDGYLLKSSGKDMLLDTIERFFEETLFRSSLLEDYDNTSPTDLNK